jgi:hypothetical protein
MERFLDTLAILSLVLAFAVLRSVRRERIRVEHSVSWLAASLLLFLLSRASGLLAFAGEWLGIRESSVTLLFLILIVFLGVFYRMSRNVSELKDMNITLTQRLALLEFELRQLNEKR